MKTKTSELERTGKQCRKESRTGNRDFDGKLGVTENGQHGGETGHDVRQDDGGTGGVPSLQSGEDEYSGADDGADAEPDEVPPVERLLHLMAASRRHLADLRSLAGSREKSVLQSPRRLQQRRRVVLPALERFLREEVIFPNRATTPLSHSSSSFHRYHYAFRYQTFFFICVSGSRSSLAHSLCKVFLSVMKS